MAMHRDMLSLHLLVQTVLVEAMERVLSLNACKVNFSNQDQGRRHVNY